MESLFGSKEVAGGFLIVTKHLGRKQLRGFLAVGEALRDDVLFDRREDIKGHLLPSLGRELKVDCRRHTERMREYRLQWSAQYPRPRGTRRRS